MATLKSYLLVLDSINYALHLNNDVYDGIKDVIGLVDMLSLGLATSESRLVALYTPTIIKFLYFPSNYKLSFEVAKYFKDCTLKIWEFIE